MHSIQNDIKFEDIVYLVRCRRRLAQLPLLKSCCRYSALILQQQLLPVLPCETNRAEVWSIDFSHTYNNAESKELLSIEQLHCK